MLYTKKIVLKEKNKKKIHRYPRPPDSEGRVGCCLSYQMVNTINKTNARNPLGARERHRLIV